MIHKDFYMSAHFSFYDSEVSDLRKRYGRCQRITDANEKTAELSKILSELKAIDKNNCSEDKRFEVEEIQLHILYTAFNSNTLPKEHEISLAELTKRYQDLVNSPGYKKLKPWEAKKQKIDRQLSKLECESRQSQGLNLSR
jgi:hypothetical protein